LTSFSARNSVHCFVVLVFVCSRLKKVISQ